MNGGLPSMTKEDQKKAHCPVCGKRAIYFRKDATYRCNRCGHEGLLDEILRGGNIPVKTTEQKKDEIKSKALELINRELTKITPAPKDPDADIKVRNDIIVRFVQDYFSYVRDIPKITTIQIYKNEPHALVFFQPALNIAVETDEKPVHVKEDEESGMAGLGALFG